MAWSICIYCPKNCVAHCTQCPIKGVAQTLCPKNGAAHLYTLSQNWRGLFVHTVPKIAWLIVRTVHKRRGSFVHNVPKKAWLKHYVPKMARLICTHSPKNCVAYLYSTVPKMARLICTVVVHTVPKMAWLICTHCPKNGVAYLYTLFQKWRGSFVLTF